MQNRASVFLPKKIKIHTYCEFILFDFVWQFYYITYFENYKRKFKRCTKLKNAPAGADAQKRKPRLSRNKPEINSDFVKCIYYFLRNLHFLQKLIKSNIRYKRHSYSQAVSIYTLFGLFRSSIISHILRITSVFWRMFGIDSLPLEGKVDLPSGKDG